MKNYVLFSLLIITVFSSNCYSQQSTTNSKNIEYTYIDPIETCERVANKGYKSIDLFQQLGNSYYSKYEFEKAAKWYGELFAMNKSIENVYYYRYAHALNCIDQVEKANKYFELYDQKSKLYYQKSKKNSGKNKSSKKS